MRLTPAQRERFETEGHLFFPGLFEADGITTLSAAVPAPYAHLATTSYPLWTADHALIAQLVRRAGGRQGGIVSPQGPAGSMILFQSCLVHASASNLSPWNRASCYLSLRAPSPVDLPWRAGMPATAGQISADELAVAA